ncbi:MAG: histidine ammonia-lyase [Elusimicrobia bacterium]|nr:histidine ammonia-lyase [Elusimicrobiota bacterium]
MKTFPLGSRPRLEDLALIRAGALKAFLPALARKRMLRSRQVLLRAAAVETVYGINTGFGELANVRIPLRQSRSLQRNVVLSHACGAGPLLDASEAAAVLFLRANELSKGYSGVRPKLVEAMAALFNRGYAPAIPSRGSVGASGDLAPLAHAASVLLGEGRVSLRGRFMPAGRALKACGLKPLELDIKEGLSLVNGTQAMQAVGGLALLDAARVLDAATLAAVMSVEALKGSHRPFIAALNQLKPHPGQVRIARACEILMKDSGIRASHEVGDRRVQDAYSLRCIPQVHGAAHDALSFVRRTVETEMDSVTDNPVVIGDEVVSGGNFHGQALSMAFDQAAIALTVLSGIAERRIFHLVSDHTGILPPFLARHPGLESGWMLAQVTAAALASENKTLAHPASADSIPTSGHKEDFVSMGMWAALKFKQVAQNAATIVALELLAAARGVEFHAPIKPGRGVAEGLRRLRGLVPRKEGDYSLSADVETVKKAVLENFFAP